MYTVYMHTTPSGKKYIGITNQNVEKRWKLGYGYKKSKYFFPAILKYGWNNIKHEILFTNLTKEDACKKEIELISLYKTNNRFYGYNLHEGGVVGERPFGYHHTEETKKKLSERHKGKKMSAEHYKKCSPTMFKKGCMSLNKGKKMPLELVEKLRKINKGNKYNLGHKWTDEQKKKMSEASKGKHYSQKTEFKKGQTPWNKGVPMTPERYEKCKATMFQKGREATNKKAIKCVETGIVYNSLKEAYEKTNILQPCLCYALKGKKNKAGGYHWKYVEPEYE